MTESISLILLSRRFDRPPHPNYHTNAMSLIKVTTVHFTFLFLVATRQQARCHIDIGVSSLPNKVFLGTNLIYFTDLFSSIA